MAVHLCTRHLCNEYKIIIVVFSLSRLRFNVPIKMMSRLNYKERFFRNKRWNKFSLQFLRIDKDHTCVWIDFSVINIQFPFNGVKLFHCNVSHTHKNIIYKLIVILRHRFSDDYRTTINEFTSVCMWLNEWFNNHQIFAQQYMSITRR